jgi:class 3 adenylate cyclase
MKKGGELNPMVQGKKIEAVFGFCDIRNFVDATEILEEDIIMFVNEVAEIVHGTIYQFTGNVNKNIGDAFLLVWKFSAQTPDLAVMSFVKILMAVEISEKLNKYRYNDKMVERFPNYRVRMGFGLHCGWAIEGTIGSNFKIDASYLSPNVNLASRLEAATKQFGVSILISGNL